MTDRPFDFDLETELRDLSSFVQFPPTPDLATSVSRAISVTPRSIPSRWRSPRAFAVAAMALLIVIAGLLALPATRHAVARWLDSPGIHISWLDDDAKPSANSNLRLGLGERVARTDIDARANFPVAVPSAAIAATPDELYLGSGEPGQVVSLLYLASSDLPAVLGTDVGLLITEFQADADSIWAGKALWPSGKVEIVRVNGADAIWISETHELSFPIDSGIGTPARATGSVLIWHADGVTYRIEGNLPLAQMRAIAESMEPVAP